MVHRGTKIPSSTKFPSGLLPTAMAMVSAMCRGWSADSIISGGSVFCLDATAGVERRGFLDSGKPRRPGITGQPPGERLCRLLGRCDGYHRGYGRYLGSGSAADVPDLAGRPLRCARSHRARNPRDAPTRPWPGRPPVRADGAGSGHTAGGCGPGPGFRPAVLGTGRGLRKTADCPPHRHQTRSRRRR